MIASRYQRAAGSVISLLEAWLAEVHPFPGLNAEDGRGGLAGRQTDMLGPPTPQVSGARQQLLHLERVAFADADLVEREIEVRLVGFEGVQIDGHEDEIVAFQRGLAVEQDVVVGGGVEAQI